MVLAASDSRATRTTAMSLMVDSSMVATVTPFVVLMHQQAFVDQLVDGLPYGGTADAEVIGELGLGQSLARAEVPGENRVSQLGEDRLTTGNPGDGCQASCHTTQPFDC
jgi:hypothetical protein